MEIQGIKIDSKFLKSLSMKFEKKSTIYKKKYSRFQKKNLILHLQNNWEKLFIMI